MLRLRALSAAALTLSLASLPAMAGPSSTVLGSIVTADRAHVGSAAAAVGTTVYVGDRLSTEAQGSVQMRAGAAAKLLLQGGSTAVVNDTNGAPSADLVMGTATFSTGNSQAFTLYASKAAIRAQSDEPTIGQVTLVNSKTLVVTSKRGPLTVTVEGETQVVEAGKSFQVLLDPEMAQGPEGAGAGGGSQGPAPKNGPPLKAGRSRFLLVAVALTGVATYFAISEAVESAARP